MSKWIIICALLCCEGVFVGLCGVLEKSVMFLGVLMRGGILMKRRGRICDFELCIRIAFGIYVVTAEVETIAITEL